MAKAIRLYEQQEAWSWWFAERRCAESAKSTGLSRNTSVVKLKNCYTQPLLVSACVYLLTGAWQSWPDLETVGNAEVQVHHDCIDVALLRLCRQNIFCFIIYTLMSLYTLGILVPLKVSADIFFEKSKVSALPFQSLIRSQFFPPNERNKFSWIRD